MDPMDAFRRLPPDWRIAIGTLDTSVMGYTDIDSRTIWIASDLTRREMRATLMHEVIHAERGDRHSDAVTEVEVQRETARRLIPWEALLGLLTRSHHPRDITDALEVDTDTLFALLNSASECELSRVRQALVNVVPRTPGDDHFCAVARWWAYHQAPGPSACVSCCPCSRWQQRGPAVAPAPVPQPVFEPARGEVERPAWAPAYGPRSLPA